MPQTTRGQWLLLAVIIVMTVAIAVLWATLSGGGRTDQPAVSAPAAPAVQPGAPAANTFTISVSDGGTGRFGGDIGYIDAVGSYRSQSVTGQYSGSWTVTGRTVTVTMQREDDLIGILQVTINGDSQSTNAPFGAVTLSAH